MYLKLFHSGFLPGAPGGVFSIRRKNLSNIFLVMRLSAILTLAFLHAGAHGISQQVTLSMQNAPLEKVFVEITKQTGYNFVYGRDILKNAKSVNVSVVKSGLNEVLKLIFKDQPLTYSIIDKVVAITTRSIDPVVVSEPRLLAPLLINIQGRVVDSTGSPIGNITYSVKGSKYTGSADSEGRFRMTNLKPADILILTSVGYSTITVSVSELLAVPAGKTTNIGNGKVLRNAEGTFTFIMKHHQEALEDVTVSIGLLDRKKETFTGVTRTFSGNDLRAASRINVLEGLNLLDPSFKIIRDNNLGSDPNQLPKVELRGSRTAPPPTPTKYSQQLKLEYEQDPNQPLFILDGFETTLQTIVNLDVNRVASITLLKDAASTALYGSRSANGVVVVETVRPSPGELQISYSATATVSVPDLSGYNLMSGEELLKFQELSSQGAKAPGPFWFDPNGNDLLLPVLKHSFRKNAILKGVNTDWERVPLQNATTLNHSLYVNGGDKYFRYNVGLSLGSNIGVMKGAENRTTTAYGTLNYRKGNINVSNNFSVGGTKQNGSPYGSFQNYVKIPTYYAANTTDRYLEEDHATYYNKSGTEVSNDFYFQNPLYNAGLPYKNTVRSLSVTNNLMANWDVLPYLRVSGGFQYSSSNGDADYFISPLNTMFDNQEAALKGSYNYSNSKSVSYKGNLMLTYNKVVADKHIINANIRGDLGQITNDGLSISAVGFAATSEPLIYLANSYQPDNRPGGSTVKSTSMALIGTVNYSYDMRYNLDLSYNLSGTSNFGSDNPYQSFYAMGIGWNIGRESFLRNSKIVNRLNLSANIGLTGNQNAGNFGSRSTYLLNNIPTYFGESVQLNGLGNPDLDWSKTYQISYSLSGTFFRNSLSLTLSGYNNITDPLIIAMPLPPSVGIEKGVPTNIGKLTSSGLELSFDARIVNTRDWTLNVGLNAPVLYKSEYSGLGNALDKFSDSARNSGYLQRYVDGSSPDDVWAVRSVGIGQARGLEVFLDKNGGMTYLFDKNNEVVIGSSRPVTQGSVNIRMRYKRFTLSVFGTYLVQEMKFNTALYDKVENLSKSDLEFNQDKRALYTRWKQVGDDASFLGIAQSSLGMSSRFLQKENSFEVSAINFNYDLLNQYSKGLKSYLQRKLGVQQINFGVTTSNIFAFRLSNVKMERGLDFPFQRSATLNLSITF